MRINYFILLLFKRLIFLNIYLLFIYLNIKINEDNVYIRGNECYLYFFFFEII